MATLIIMQKRSILSTLACRPLLAITDWAGDPQWVGAIISVMRVAPINEKGIG